MLPTSFRHIINSHHQTPKRLPDREKTLNRPIRQRALLYGVHYGLV